jgi:hypothetical protein
LDVVSFAWWLLAANWVDRPRPFGLTML